MRAVLRILRRGARASKLGTRAVQAGSHVHSLALKPSEFAHTRAQLSPICLGLQQRGLQLLADRLHTRAAGLERPEPRLGGLQPRARLVELLRHLGILAPGGGKVSIDDVMLACGARKLITQNGGLASGELQLLPQHPWVRADAVVSAGRRGHDARGKQPLQLVVEVRVLIGQLPGPRIQLADGGIVGGDLGLEPADREVVLAQEWVQVAVRAGQRQQRRGIHAHVCRVCSHARTLIHGQSGPQPLDLLRKNLRLSQFRVRANPPWRRGRRRCRTQHTGRRTQQTGRWSVLGRRIGGARGRGRRGERGLGREDGRLRRGIWPDAP
eukprot:m.9518 g.9518  ORF g.9518 m.9518 type:complete len:325 (+) comp2420_c0_seq2:1165-2139(+)